MTPPKPKTVKRPAFGKRRTHARRIDPEKQRRQIEAYLRMLEMSAKGKASE